MSLYLGAYALFGGLDAQQEAAGYAALREWDLAGLELPLVNLVPGWLKQHADPVWDLVVTCIPAVMGALALNPTYGLASPDEAGREAALADVRHALERATAVDEMAGRRRVTAVQIHSAPSLLAAAEPFARSLDEIARWGIDVPIILEHCDAPRAGGAHAKGFLTLAQELAVLAGREVKLGVNWGRSAIEGESAATALEHVVAAAAAGKLAGVIFSGATNQDTAWGPAWGDMHIPPRGRASALAGSAASLLDAEAIDAATVLIPEGAYRGVKVTVRPLEASVDERLAVARAGLDLLG